LTNRTAKGVLRWRIPIISGLLRICRALAVSVLLRTEFSGADDPSAFAKRTWAIACSGLTPG